MSRMRSSISKKNKWWIPSERYLELKHFCLQYETWIERRKDIILSMPNSSEMEIGRGNVKTDPIVKAVIAAKYYEDLVIIVVSSCKKASEDIWWWILEGVTKDLGYEELRARGIPCGKDYYYEAYHKFFYILDKERK